MSTSRILASRDHSNRREYHKRTLPEYDAWDLVNCNRDASMREHIKAYLGPCLLLVST